jgi:hypothetical protein
MEAKAYVDGKVACQATLTCSIVPRVPEAAPEAAEAPPESKPEAAQ